MPREIKPLMTYRLLLVLPLLAACGRNPTPAPTTTPTTPVSLAPSPVPAPPRHLPAKLDLPPGADATHVELLQSVCALAWLPDEQGKVTVGCTSHPPFVEREQLPSGDLPRFSRDRMDLCTIAAVYRGSFSRPAVSEAVVAFDECHDDGDSFSSSSFFSRSVLLLERVDGRWKATAYEAAKDASDCLVRTVPNDRDTIVCRSSFAASRLGEITYLYTIDFGKKTDNRIDTFARFYANLFECDWFEESKWQLDYGFVTFKIDQFSVSPATGAVEIDVQRGRLAPSASLATKVRAECKKRPTSDGKAIAARPQTTRLTFPPRGHSFAPDPTAEKLLDAWSAESKEVAAEMGDAAPR